MNRIYKVVWSKARNCYVVASELAKRHTKGSGTRSLSRAAVTLGIVAGLTVGMTGSAWAANAGTVTVAVPDDASHAATVTGTNADGVSTLVTLEAESIGFTGSPVITGVNSLAITNGLTVGTAVSLASESSKINGVIISDGDLRTLGTISGYVIQGTSVSTTSLTAAGTTLLQGNTTIGTEAAPADLTVYGNATVKAEDGDNFTMANQDAERIGSMATDGTKHTIVTQTAEKIELMAGATDLTMDATGSTFKNDLKVRVGEGDEAKDVFKVDGTTGVTTVGGLKVGTGENIKDRTAALTTDGEVAENNAGYVTGGTVYSAVGGLATNVGGIERDRETETDPYTTTIEGTVAISEKGSVTIGRKAGTLNADDAGVTADLSVYGNTTVTGAATVGSLDAGSGAIKTTGVVSGSNLTVATPGEGNSYSYIAAGTDVAGNLVKLDTQVKTNADAIGGLKTTVGDANSGLVKAVADNTTAISTNASAITALQGTVGDANSGLVKGVTDLQTTVGDANSGLVKYVADNASAITALQGTVGDANSGLVKGVADNASAITSLQGTVGDANSGLVKDVTDLKTNVGDNASAITALQGTVGDANSGLVKAVADNTSAISTNASAITALQGTVGDANSGLVKDVTDLQGTVGDANSGLVKGVADNANAITALQATVGDANSGLVKDVADHAGAIADNASAITALQGAVGDDNSGLVKDVNDLKKNISTDDQGNINRLDNKINKAGAGAAALAALHPLDMDGKFGMGIGYGNYRNANAMALGMFYKPQDNLMFSIGGSMGNGENMVNAGISIALDKGFGNTKAAMARKINALSAENEAIKAELAELKAAIKAMQKQK